MLDKDITVNNKTYNVKLYLKNQNIIFKLESLNNNEIKKYENSFRFDDLQNLDPFFKQSNDLFGVFKLFRQLFNTQISLEEGDSFADFKFNIVFLNKEIKIHLIEKKENHISYNSLSEQMKSIIDNNELILGIDLGTTYSCASVMLDNNIIVIQNSLGLRTTPSFILFLDNNKICVGELAKLQPSYEENIIYNTKRLLGKSLNDYEIKSIKNNLLFKLEKDNEYDLMKIKVKDNYYYPDQISAMILKKIINDSEYFLSKKLDKRIKIKNAIITAPAYFNNKQRKAILNAANIINLKVKRIINEPTAASLAFLYQNLNNIEKTVLVLDFGGGTFDITLLYLRQSENSSYCDIKCTGGDPNFGGEDFDDILMEKCVQSINKSISNKNLRHNIRLKRACENAKIKLSSINKTNIFIEEYLPSVNIELSITKEEFEEYCSELFIKFQKIIEDFLNDNKVDKNTISEVIPIGGSTLIPKIKEIIKNIFNNSEIKTDLNPKEVVAIGASVQGGILSKLQHLNNYDLLDITNYSLGVELVGEKMSKVIKRYTPIPIQEENEYVNAYDYPESIQVKVYEGEDENIKNNLFLGEFSISNLPKKKKNQIKIKIKFHIDTNSILNVTATEKEKKVNSNKSFNLEKNNEIKIINPKGLILIIDQLKQLENSMEYFEDTLYIDTIKESIIEAENVINNSQKNQINNKEIKEKNKYIIVTFGNFINKKLNEIYEFNNENKENKEENKKQYEQKLKLLLSYIKYYFKKIANYFKNYVEDNEFRKVILDQDNLGNILKEIQFYNPTLLPEIIEEFSDDKQLFDKCIISLILNLYSQLTELFMEKDFQKADNNYLCSLEKKVNYIISLFNKLKPIPVDIKYMKDYLKAFKLKIEAKKYILSYNFFSKFFPGYTSNLNNLIERYKKTKDYDVTILNELTKLKISLFRNNTDMTKEKMFLKKFENEKKDRDFLFSILNEYPIIEDKNTQVYIDMEYKQVFGLNNQKELNFLNDAKIKYDRTLEIIKENKGEEIQQIYEKIIELINTIKLEINNKNN